MTEHEIRQNYLSGLHSKVNKESTKDIGFKAKGPVTRYLLDEEKGDVIYDSGSVLNPVNLFMPKYIGIKTKRFLSFSNGSLLNDSGFPDIIINILIFIPLGILIHGKLRTHFGITLKISLATLLAATLFVLVVESLQHFSLTRNSSLIDVFANMTGIAIGIVIDRVYSLFLYRTT